MGVLGHRFANTVSSGPAVKTLAVFAGTFPKHDFSFKASLCGEEESVKVSLVS